MSFVRVCALSEVPDEGVLGVDVDGTPVAVVRAGGEVYALQDEDAHAVWIGDVIIRAEAEGTDTYELNRNLVLTDGTRVDSVPNLEILTGEVAGAGHASASGRLDDQQLFYLQARGIPHDLARRMVVRGFLGQLVEKIDLPQIQERVLAAIDEELDR